MNWASQEANEHTYQNWSSITHVRNTMELIAKSARLQTLAAPVETGDASAAAEDTQEEASAAAQDTQEATAPDTHEATAPETQEATYIFLLLPTVV